MATDSGRAVIPGTSVVATVVSRVDDGFSSDNGHFYSANTSYIGNDSTTYFGSVNPVSNASRFELGCQQC